MGESEQSVEIFKRKQTLETDTEVGLIVGSQMLDIPLLQQT